MKRNRVKLWALAVLFLAMGSVSAREITVDRGAYALQAQESGSGAVTVVFESGFGQGAGVWKDVITGLGEDYHSIAYARAGLGKSGSNGQPKRIDEHLADLTAVIDTLAPGRKVVLVGHSYGGLLATEFARRHPDRLQGLVLVDPATMGQRHAFRQADAARIQADDTSLRAMLSPAMVADYAILIEQLDAPGAQTPQTMPDVPVALLTATQIASEPLFFEETAQGKALWKIQHALLFSGFTRGSHRYLDTGHNLHRENPAAVVSAIQSVSARP
ncbi:alpha/beta fold hydrolase [Stenotrophomonas sp. NRRL B-14846]|uniref:alpha/beta fold hydrolase n=1 Tax=Stenotrophomonas sp. NRRL B-14846 TaxID=3162882 RepID=UPI003D2CD918